MSESEASFHDDDDSGGGRGGGRSVEDNADDRANVVADAADADAADVDAAVAHEEEVAHSLKKMGKIVNNLIARADSVPFREPGERERERAGDGRTIGEERVLIIPRICLFTCASRFIPCFSFLLLSKWTGRAFR
jgi:hypothetical protein